jgi:hypothetical protein
MSDTAVYQSAQVVAANALLTTIPGQFLLQPSGQNKTKFGLSITSGGACIVQGASPSSSNLTIQEIVP